ncbi:MAG: hypothetical protein Q9209_001252 [Squamulea sp. 1 TL-2023]
MALTHAETLRLCEEMEERHQRRKRERALALGFSCLEECEQSERKQWRQREHEHEELMKQESAITGVTVEELEARMYENNPQSPVGLGLLPNLADCDCEEHAFDCFCPLSLVHYKSQDVPNIMGYLDCLHHPKVEEVKIEVGDRSKRLDQNLLEQRWVRDPTDVPMDIPFWAKADKVVQQIIRQDTHRNTSVSPSLPSSPPRTPSLIHYEHSSGSPSVEDIMTTQMDICTEYKSRDQPLPVVYDPKTVPSESIQGLPRRSYCQKRKAIARVGKPSRRCSKAIKRARWAAGRDSRVAKETSRPAMGLRSHKLTRFYELS